ncbi:MAG: DUF58 domain-containing protein [Pseudohongiella sp.]|nr:DUF58 domain-containing protein [Pseudohongiella sp.]
MDTGIGQRAARLSLIGRLSKRWQGRHTRWLNKRVPPMSALALGRRTIFILPTPQGALIGIAALAISLIALAQRNVVAVLLASLMLSLFLVCLILTYRNLSGLLIQSANTRRASASHHCFEGEQALFVLQLAPSSPQRKHCQLGIGFESQSMKSIESIHGLGTTVELQQTAFRRGVMSAPRLLIASDYPLGLWRAWSRPDLAMHCLVYPRPIFCEVPEDVYHSHVTQAGVLKAAAQSGNDDFSGLREYQPGDTPRQIHWQSLARGHGLQTKQFVREEQPEIILDCDRFAGRDNEQILSCLCYQILQLSRRHRVFGLRLPGVFEASGKGDTHKHRLLRELALFPAEQVSPQDAAS